MPRISIDDTDLSIIRELNSLKMTESISTYSLAKAVFGKPENIYEGRRLDNLVRKRLEKLYNYGLVDIIKEKRTTNYLLVTDNVYVRQFVDKDVGIAQKSYFLKINNQWFTFPMSV